MGCLGAQNRRRETEEGGGEREHTREPAVAAGAGPTSEARPAGRAGGGRGGRAEGPPPPAPPSPGRAPPLPHPGQAGPARPSADPAAEEPPRPHAAGLSRSLGPQAGSVRAAGEPSLGRGGCSQRARHAPPRRLGAPPLASPGSTAWTQRSAADRQMDGWVDRRGGLGCGRAGGRQPEWSPDPRGTVLSARGRHGPTTPSWVGLFSLSCGLCSALTVRPDSRGPSGGALAPHAVTPLQGTESFTAASCSRAAVHPDPRPEPTRRTLASSGT